MYLKKISISGFKSFADKINIDLDNKITGIVGPNGSGKSNVVDAIRWVLGEQSVKSLRGDGNMSDVIFAGTSKRNKQNVASVTLIFDNSDKYLPLDYLEVSIKRRLYRDGTNEYFINDEKCRLKDVTDLLLDTGIAKESLNIISQGQVEKIVLDKPDDRRVIFEEAAGVLKYKKRKEEALRKLDKTHDNISRVNDIINEIDTQLEPLKEQKEKALIYKDVNEKLENLEISLITEEITNINFEYQDKKKQIDNLNKEIVTYMAKTSQSESKIEEYKLEITNLDQELNDLQNKYTEKIKEVEQINSRKNILLERKKYDVDDTKLHNELVNLQEEKLKINTDINKLENEIETNKEELNSLTEKHNEVEKELRNLQNNQTDIQNNLRNKILEKSNLEHKVDYLKEAIENNSSLPSSIRSILNNPKLTGIYNTIGKIIELDEMYALAVTTSLGFAINNVITEDEESAKGAIKYLMDNKLGRVTFFPINLIKERFIPNDIIEKIKIEKGYIDVASNLVKCEDKYKKIIDNQLGNVIIVDNIDNANNISKKINHAYKIVTLDGTILHIGGSLTGGTTAKQKNVISEKYELEESLKKLDNIVLEIKELENVINENDYKYKAIEDKIYILSKNKINSQEFINNKQIIIDDLKIRLDNILNEEKGTKDILNGGLTQEEKIILEEYYKAINEKNKLEEELQRLKNKKDSLNAELEDYEFSIKQENSLFNNKNKELNTLEIAVNRMDVKLDTLLTKLSETYSITYEKAKENYKLDIDIKDASNIVDRLRRKIRELGPVNLEAIEEYDRVNERYNFLNTQKEDLIKAEDTLLEIIKEMDEVMIKEFASSFEIINQNFSETFKELFKGGTATLKLTDPDNLLETGIEIVAQPPGKSLKSISLLSGGEKTFTAISLLFAILKSRKVPFCVLDEVEAALDEANVDSFGEYITKLKEKTQFILITHKKRTMEYADNLYGVTMQESGVSTLVSVKLEEF